MMLTRPPVFCTASAAVCARRRARTAAITTLMHRAQIRLDAPPVRSSLRIENESLAVPGRAPGFSLARLQKTANEHRLDARRAAAPSRYAASPRCRVRPPARPRAPSRRSAARIMHRWAVGTPCQGALTTRTGRPLVDALRRRPFAARAPRLLQDAHADGARGGSLSHSRVMLYTVSAMHSRPATSYPPASAKMAAQRREQGGDGGRLRTSPDCTSTLETPVQRRGRRRPYEALAARTRRRSQGKVDGRGQQRLVGDGVGTARSRSAVERR